MWAESREKKFKAFESGQVVGGLPNSVPEDPGEFAIVDELDVEDLDSAENAVPLDRTKNNARQYEDPSVPLDRTNNNAREFEDPLSPSDPDLSRTSSSSSLASEEAGERPSQLIAKQQHEEMLRDIQEMFELDEAAAQPRGSIHDRLVQKFASGKSLSLRIGGNNVAAMSEASLTEEIAEETNDRRGSLESRATTDSDAASLDTIPDRKQFGRSRTELRTSILHRVVRSFQSGSYDLGLVGWLVGWYQQALDGSFSAVSKPSFTGK